MDHQTTITVSLQSRHRNSPSTHLFQSLIPGFGTACIRCLHKATSFLGQDLCLQHRQASEAIRKSSKSLGLTQPPCEDSEAANGLTALHFPPGVTAADLLPRLLRKGVVVVAGRLHVDIKDKYFRIRHMGISVVHPSREDVNKVIKSLGEALKEEVTETKAKVDS